MASGKTYKAPDLTLVVAPRAPSLPGGGSVLGTLCGAVLMAVIDNGCTILRIPDPVQDLIVGAIIILAVTLDQLRQNMLPKRRATV